MSLEERIVKCLQRAEILKEDTDFDYLKSVSWDNYGINSINFVIFMVELEKEFKISIDAEYLDYKMFKDIEDVKDKLELWLKEQMSI